LYDRKLIEYGRGLVAPLAMGFLIWVAKEIKADKKLIPVFVSREGKFLSEMWTELFPDSPFLYLPFSRALGYKINLGDSTSQKMLLTSDFSGDFENFLMGKIGFSKNEVRKVFDVADLQVPFRNNSDSRIKLKKMARAVAEQSLEMKNDLKGYLAANIVEKNPKFALVDVGYNGTIQFLLEIAMKVPTLGLYMLTSNSKIDVVKKAWYLENAPWTNLQLSNSLVLETLLQADTGPCVGYKRVISQISPVYGSLDLPALAFRDLRMIQGAALEFIHESKPTIVQNMDLFEEVGKSILSALLTSPKLLSTEFYEHHHLGKFDQTTRKGYF
jgi:hypothetical protein